MAKCEHQYRTHDCCSPCRSPCMERARVVGVSVSVGREHVSERARGEGFPRGVWGGDLADDRPSPRDAHRAVSIPGTEYLFRACDRAASGSVISLGYWLGCCGGSTWFLCV